ncbi:P1 family peptidase [Patulibacter sp. S7RM1-6]
MTSLIDGIRIGHWTDAEAATGMTVFLLPDGNMTAAEARGQSTGTLNIPVYEPQGVADHADAIVLTGGTIFGLEAAAHVPVALAREGLGVPTPDGPVPMVPAAVVYDIHMGSYAWPTAASAEHAIANAVPAGQEEIGTVGVGTGVLAGSAIDSRSATKGGFGRAWRTTAQGATIAVWAAVNPVGDVMGEDGRVLAGLRRGGQFVGVADTLMNDPEPELDWGRATTLVVVATDAKLPKRETWRLAQAGHNGIAHAISPCATGLDGDTAFAVATGKVEVRSALALEAAAAVVTSEAIRNAVRAATGLHGIPSASELEVRTAQTIA